MSAEATPDPIHRFRPPWGAAAARSAPSWPEPAPESVSSRSWAGRARRADLGACRRGKPPRLQASPLGLR